ncbi:endoribonuclease Dicer homolog 3-like [Chenopodium quinoa]|uniref:Uncharacterized protein n=1 Tax=Chenopodium quinoa TaxID=63459 RepID=A0A803LIT6_CHEQI|nr:endoribonuclease Dicer homolog 3-like [Chenopodium quinoa]
MDILDDHHIEGRDEIDPKVKCNESAGAGTTKRKELHGTVHVNALSGTWRDNPHGAVFHAYKIDFSCDCELYPGFVLLTELKLDEDVANTKVDLYLLDKMVKSSVMPCGEVHLESDQIRRAMRFHELLFNGLYGKLFLGSKASGVNREFLLQRDNDLLWSTSYIYLILPIKSLDIVDDGSWSIDWKGIDSCVSVVEFMRNSAWLSAEQSGAQYRSSIGDPSSAGGAGENTVHLANRSLSIENLEETVVMSIHTGRIYYVREVLVNTSAESPFDSNVDGAPSKYTSFADYFSKKYGIVLFYPGQPLLLLKQTHNPFNLLSDSEASALRRKMLSSGDLVDSKRQNHVHMPPELLVCIDIQLSTLRALYLIPSLIHRLESVMLACQLRKEIAYNFRMPSSLILEALTTLRCCEDFSSERLELLGDSVLKYVVSCHVFLKSPYEHEGKLSGQRQSTICNANLHKLGTKRKLHEYIRDSAFEPRRWVAPGQLSVHPVPCSHGVDTSEVPLDSRFHTIDENTVLGKSCDKGHRWLVSKSIADCVEAVIGAYYVGGGLMAALHMMKWLGIEAELGPGYVDKAINLASDRSCIQKVDQITALESKLGYDFSTKGLLLEAITHLTEQESGVGYCYERLEFLGDAVLDVLITWHLYQNHTDIDPGELTDLRSASVNNENFAQVSVRRNLYQHLQLSSESISKQITEYVTLVMDAEDSKSLQGRQCPKVLGDLLESIAGAILIDTKLNVEEVWRIFFPLLSPIVTPDNLELPPFRELNELCDRLGYFFKEHCINDKDVVLAELRLQLEDILLIGEGIGKTKKAAKGQAALYLLKGLDNKGMSYDKCVLKRKKQELNDVSSGLIDMKFSVMKSKHTSHKKQKVSQLPCGDNEAPDAAIPVIAAVKTDKGGPRNSLYELCKRLQWPMPSFETTEQKSRSPIEFGEGSDKRTGFNGFTSKISLLIPDSGVMEAMGEQRADKKSSQDSAALHLLYELEQQGKLVINC